MTRKIPTPPQPLDQLPAQPPTLSDLISAQIGDQAQIIAVGKGITQVVYQGIRPTPLDHATLAAATANLAHLPIETIPPVAPLPPGSRMPFSANPLFVGRTADLLALAAALKGGETVAVSQIAAATGLGGIGKTQLAVAFVHHYGHFFEGGVHWLNFADGRAIAAEISACGLEMTELRADFATLDSESQVRLVLAAWQSALPRLLVFDNCEEPLGPVASPQRRQSRLGHQPSSPLGCTLGGDCAGARHLGAIPKP